MKPKLSYNLKEAAEATGLSYWTIRREVKAGRLNTSKVRGCIVIFAASLQALLEQGRKDFIAGQK